VCGDGFCTGSEDASTCATDCAVCGDSICSGSEGEDTCTCPGDCGTSCGDGCCNGGETSASCSVDCGSYCGDGTCDIDETPATCPADCYIIEDFETGTWPWSPWSSVGGGGTVGASYAHDGSRGINDVGWYYRTDVSFGSTTGEILSAWTRVGTSGRTYFGFCASASGSRSLVVAPNTNELIFQHNDSYGYVDATSAVQTYTSGQWYYMEIENLGSGNFQGRLYASDGTTLLNSVSFNFSAYCPGGVSMRSFGGFAIDTIERHMP
jgi:hypothetical protein